LCSHPWFLQPVPECRIHPTVPQATAEMVEAAVEMAVLETVAEQAEAIFHAA